MNNFLQLADADIDRIKATFIHAEEGIPGGVAALASIIQYYQGTCSIPELTEMCFDKEMGFVTLAKLEAAAKKYGFYTHLMMLDIEKLKKQLLPCIQFFKNEVGQLDFVVYYGVYGKRFFVGEPLFTFMYYFPEEMDSMWVKGETLGIALDLFPGPDFWEIQKQREEERRRNTFWGKLRSKFQNKKRFSL